MITVTVLEFAAFYEVLSDTILEKENKKGVMTRESVWDIYKKKRKSPFYAEKAKSYEYFRVRYRQYHPSSNDLRKEFRLNHAAVFKALVYIGIKGTPDIDLDDSDDYPNAKSLFKEFKIKYKDRINKIERKYTDKYSILIETHTTNVLAIDSKLSKETLAVTADFINYIQHKQFVEAWKLLTEGYKSEWEGFMGFVETHKRLQFIDAKFINTYKDDKAENRYACLTILTYTLRTKKLPEQSNMNFSLLEREKFLEHLNLIRKKLATGYIESKEITIDMLFSDKLYAYALKKWKATGRLRALIPFSVNETLLRQRVIFVTCVRQDDEWLIDNIWNAEDPNVY